MDKNALTTPRLKTDTHEIPDVGVVTFRGLSRWELLEANKRADRGGQVAMEQFMLSCAMLDPAMTEADVAEWQKAGPGGEVIPIQKKINVLSGIGKAAAKSDVPGDGDRPVD